MVSARLTRHVGFGFAGLLHPLGIQSLQTGVGVAIYQYGRCLRVAGCSYSWKAMIWVDYSLSGQFPKMEDLNNVKHIMLVKKIG